MRNRRKYTYTSSVGPEHFPPGSAQSRAAARGLLMENQKRVQMIFSCPEDPLNLETSECFRSMCPDGTIIEVVLFDGNADELSRAEQEEFILGYPISYDGKRNTVEQLEE
jgi:hypothetical protein